MLVVVEAPIDTISITYLSKEVDIKDEHFEKKKKEGAWGKIVFGNMSWSTSKVGSWGLRWM